MDLKITGNSEIMLIILMTIPFMVVFIINRI